jgi:hypothetical protein
MASVGTRRPNGLRRRLTWALDLMSPYVEERVIDYEAVIRRGGANLGDEDFALFKCPTCSRIYLLEYEVDTIYLDGTDPSQRYDDTDSSRRFVCVGCHLPLPEGRVAGPRRQDQFLVTWKELKESPWAWIATPLGSFENEI